MSRGAVEPIRKSAQWSALALVAGLLFATTEVVARALTKPGRNSEIPTIGPIPLLPYVPTEGAVRRWHRKVTDDADYLKLDPVLGWTFMPDGTHQGPERINAQGIRGPEGVIYDPARPTNRVRMMTTGDSFMLGAELAFDDTMQRQLERRIPGLETLNIAVSGYGTDQATLRWETEGHRFQGHWVLLGIWPENMVRNLNSVRFGILPATSIGPKPRFELGPDGTLALHPPTVDADDLVSLLTTPILAEEEFWIDPEDLRWSALYNLRTYRFAVSLERMIDRKRARDRLYTAEDPRGIELTLAIAKRFATAVEAQGEKPAIIIFPMRTILPQFVERELPLVTRLRADGHRVIDLTPAFAKAMDPAHFDRTDHLSPSGADLAAEIAAPILAEWMKPDLEAALLATSH